jgi:hypothetical protein
LVFNGLDRPVNAMEDDLARHGRQQAKTLENLRYFMLFFPR